MGMQLMNSGMFGDPVHLDKLMKKKLATRILDREIAGGTHYQRRFLNKNLSQVSPGRETGWWRFSNKVTQGHVTIL